MKLKIWIEGIVFIGIVGEEVAACQTLHRTDVFLLSVPGNLRWKTAKGICQGSIKALG